MGLPTITVVYVCPTANFGIDHFNKAVTFASSLNQFPAGYAHKFVVISNGGKPDLQTEALFAPFNPVFFERANLGKDVGSYLHAAKTFPCDLMVFLGGNTYIRGAKWLVRIAQSFMRRGVGLYGSMRHMGIDAMGIGPHIRTTGFWMPPDLLNQYPFPVTQDDNSRYQFEYGPNSLTEWTAKQGLGTWAVTWLKEYSRNQWERIPDGGFGSPTEAGLIFGDRLTQPYTP